MGLRVAVTSNLKLLEETVAAALEDSGARVTRVPWPRRPPPLPAAPGAPVQPPAPRREEPLPDVVVLVCEPVGASSVAALLELQNRYGARLLVIGGARPGPWWGAMLNAGADAVVASTTTLPDLLEVIDALVRGEPVMGVVERQVLIRQWLTARADQKALRERLSLLSPREREVLEMLHRGDTAAVIATTLGVSQATVRSQIRGVLAKLEVRSQLAAVATLESALAELPGEG